MSKRLRTGFTLIELMTTIAIVGTLMALAWPAIQTARESARRNTCLQRIGQIAIAVESHHSAHGVFPPGRFLGNFGGGKDSTAWSWMAMTLPFIEEQALFDRGDIPFATLADSKVASAHIAMFLCPSAGGELSMPKKNAGNLVGFEVGQSTYKGVSGANWGADKSQGKWSVRTPFRNGGTHGSYDGLGNGDGLMWRSDIERRMNHRRICDGASNTFLIGEDLPRLNTWSSWPYSNNAYGTCAIPPNFVPNDPNWQYESYSFRSDHPGGLNFAFADSSARFISTDIETDIYRGFGTRCGNESRPPSL